MNNLSAPRFPSYQSIIMDFVVCENTCCSLNVTVNPFHSENCIRYPRRSPLSIWSTVDIAEITDTHILKETHLQISCIQSIPKKSQWEKGIFSLSQPSTDGANSTSMSRYKTSYKTRYKTSTLIMAWYLFIPGKYQNIALNFDISLHLLSHQVV